MSVVSIPVPWFGPLSIPVPRWWGRGRAAAGDPLTPEARARIAYDGTVADSLLESDTLTAARKEQKKRAKQYTARQNELLARIGGTELDQARIAAGVFAMLMWVAALGLNYTLFAALGFGPFVSGLLATVELAVFAGIGTLALGHRGFLPVLNGDTWPRRAVAAALLTVLVLGGWLVAATLGPARADELYAADIHRATQQLANQRSTSADPLDVAATQGQLDALQAAQERTSQVSTAVLALVIGVEVLLSGHGFDLLVYTAALRHKKLATACADEARALDAQARLTDRQLQADLPRIADDFGFHDLNTAL